REAVSRGINIQTLPGPTAFVPALVNSGLPCDRFIFEGFLPPKKGRNHILRLIRDLVDTEPQGKGTDLGEVLRHLTNVLKKRSIVFVLSDFMNTGEDYQDALSIARRRHDVVGLHLYDDREVELPNMGLVRVIDAESGQSTWLDTANKSTRMAYGKWYHENLRKTKQMFIKSGADFLSINTKDSYVQALLGLFNRRASRA
ncbi:MAG: VWA domain-containing protein, partial [Bacteroidota bacterium]